MFNFKHLLLDFVKALKDKDIKALGYERRSFTIGAWVMYTLIIYFVYRSF